jgi:hypothetical protein
LFINIVHECFAIALSSGVSQQLTNLKMSVKFTKKAMNSLHHGRAKTIDRDMRVGCGNLDQNGWPSKKESGEKPA